jgi:hypothetical protein
MRRIGLALVVLGLLAAGARWLVHALTSDETKIRVAIEEACEGFGDKRMDPILAVLARDFRDETSGFGREDVRGAVAGAFFGEKDPETKGFPFRCEIDPQAIEIQLVKGDPDRATVALTGTVVDLRGGTRREAWSFQLTGRMEERDDGWCFVTTEHRTTGGNYRLRSR